MLPKRALAPVLPEPSAALQDKTGVIDRLWGVGVMAIENSLCHTGAGLGVRQGVSFARTLFTIFDYGRRR